MARTTTLRWSDEELAEVDRVRGDVPRERWVRRLCADAVAAHDVANGGTRPVAMSVAGEGQCGRVVPSAGELAVVESVDPVEVRPVSTREREEVRHKALLAAQRGGPR